MFLISVYSGIHPDADVRCQQVGQLSDDVQIVYLRCGYYLLLSFMSTRNLDWEQNTVNCFHQICSICSNLQNTKLSDKMLIFPLWVLIWGYMRMRRRAILYPERQKISRTGIEPVTDGYQLPLQSTALPTELSRVDIYDDIFMQYKLYWLALTYGLLCVQ